MPCSPWQETRESSTYMQKCVCFQFISLQHFSVHRLCPLSFLLFGPKPDNTYPAAGAPVCFEGLWASASQPATQPASQEHDRFVLSTLGLSGPLQVHTYIHAYIHTHLHSPRWAPSQLMKGYRSSVQICDAAQKCRVSFPGSLIRAA